MPNKTQTEVTQPPALDEEPEVFILQCDDAGPYDFVLADAYRAHVAQLLAEIERLRMESKIEFDRLAHEHILAVCRNSAYQCTEQHSYMQSLKTDYKNWFPHKWVIDAIRNLIGINRTTCDSLRAERDTLKAELTEAREFLVHIKKCLSRNKEYAPLSQQELDGLIGHSPSASCRNECGCLWCSQAAPAAKDGE